jgi:hypothetical protein
LLELHSCGCFHPKDVVFFFFFFCHPLLGGLRGRHVVGIPAGAALFSVHSVFFQCIERQERIAVPMMRHWLLLQRR